MERLIKYLNDNSISYTDTNFYLNRIDFSKFNVDEFNKKYNITILVYEGEEDNKYIDFHSNIFSELTKESTIEAISFKGGSWVYILTKKDVELDLDKILDKLEQNSNFKKNQFTYKYMSITQDDLDYKIECSNRPMDFIYCNKDKVDTVYNLLLNSLARNYDEISNLDAQLYIYIQKDNRSIRTLNISVEKGLLCYKIQSFMLYKDKLKSLGNNKSKIEKLEKAPKYILKNGANNSVKLERCYNIKEKNLYIKGSSKKRSIKYDILEVNKATKTKLKTIFELINDFNYEHDNICKLDFLKQNGLFIKMGSKSLKDFKNKFISNYNSLESINILPAADIDPDNPLFEKLCADFKILGYDIELNVSNEFAKDSLNIVVHHDKEYYEKLKIDDIKNTFPTDIIYQGITIESLADTKDFKSILNKVLSELFIKRELFARKISDWKFGEMEFYLGIKSIDKEESTIKNKVYRVDHCLMKIHEDGSFDITNNPDEISVEFTKLTYDIKDKNDHDRIGSICLIKKDDNINLIEHTEYALIPDKETWENEIKQSIKDSLTSRSRAGEKLDKKTLFPYVDKLIFKLNGEFHYSIGLNRGFDTSISSLNNVYKICIPDDSEIIPEIFNMLENLHVRSNRTESTRPYPFKHLSEYLRVNNVGVDIRII